MVRNNSDNYPTMSSSEWNKAPFNSKDEKTVFVTVSVTMSKTFPVKVDKYKIVEEGRTGDGAYYEEIECDEQTLRQAVEEQVNLPQDAGNLFEANYKFPPYAKDKISKDLKGWCVDDFEVVME